MADYTTIAKNPTLEPDQDYRLLRQAGMDYIESLGSQYWTDYNIHDPGITVLELLCYAITDLGYRTSFNIKDLLALPSGKMMDPAEQAFFTGNYSLIFPVSRTHGYNVCAVHAMTCSSMPTVRKAFCNMQPPSIPLL